MKPFPFIKNKANAQMAIISEITQQLHNYLTISATLNDFKLKDQYQIKSLQQYIQDGLAIWNCVLSL